MLIFTGVLGIVWASCLPFHGHESTTELRTLAGAARVVAEGDLTRTCP